MKTIGNLFWLLFGGIVLGVLWLVAGLLCCVTIVGIPLGLQCFKFARLVFWPFGREIDYSGMGGVSFIVNVLWLLLLGQELAIIALVLGAVCCVTIVGIPFGLQHFKFAKLALLPFGARIVRTQR